MKIKTEVYTLELNGEELSVLKNAVKYAYNDLYHKQNPNASMARTALDTAYYALNTPENMEELKKINNILLKEFGGIQSW